MSIEQFAELLKKGGVVFFGGAGVSTESGLPDFRGTGGLYYQKYKFPPETILSQEFFFSRTADFYEFYYEKLVAPKVLPNKAHIALAKLEKAGLLSSVITQNIDGLHQDAGSKKVLELHGSILRNYCQKCGKFFPREYITDKIPRCDCGGLVKPDVVLYGETLDGDVLNAATAEISSAKTLIVGGTSLGVYPASGLVRFFRKGKIVLINKTETSLDGSADFIFRENIGEVLDKAVNLCL
ncbi:NAD-dependent protein deacetylase [Clostridia bacterium]|nr:NAD-dependent protein deacetylase [Clostridia bacterium]